MKQIWQAYYNIIGIPKHKTPPTPRLPKLDKIYNTFYNFQAIEFWHYKSYSSRISTITCKCSSLNGMGILIIQEQQLQATAKLKTISIDRKVQQ